MKLNLKKKEVAYLAAMLGNTNGGGYDLYKYLSDKCMADEKSANLYKEYYNSICLQRSSGRKISVPLDIK